MLTTAIPGADAIFVLSTGQAHRGRRLHDYFIAC